MMTVKEALHRLIDELDEIDAEEALDYLQWLLSDSDTLTEEELALERQGEEEIARGEYITLDELQRDLCQ